jgi:hypothetical protein
MPNVEGDSTDPNVAAVLGVSKAGGDGVVGRGHRGVAGYGLEFRGYLGQRRPTPAGPGVYGESKGGRGVEGRSDTNYGVSGDSRTFAGVRGTSVDVAGTEGWSTTGPGVFGRSENSSGVVGVADNWGPERAGVLGSSPNGAGVLGTGSTGVVAEGGGFGVIARGGSFGLMARTTGGGILDVGIFCRGRNGLTAWADSKEGRAGTFSGDVEIYGELHKSGGGFRIDHPADPANKYLTHSFVESPTRSNLYDGTVVLDDSGAAEVELPGWFEELNTDFRYQLTAVGGPAPELHVGRTVENGRFAIAGGSPGLTVSWQVTGTRQDPWARANPMPVESDKPEHEQGRYLHPELYGQPADLAVARDPELERKLREMQAEPPAAPGAAD